MKKRIEITVETDRILLISRRKVSALAWCSACGQRVKMVMPDEAGAIARVSSRTIYRWVEDAKVHFLERHDGLLLICLNSLPKTSLDTWIENDFQERPEGKIQ